MIGKLNHVGVATPSIEASVKMYREMLGATDFSETFSMPEQGVWVGSFYARAFCWLSLAAGWVWLPRIAQPPHSATSQPRLCLASTTSP